MILSSHVRTLSALLYLLFTALTFFVFNSCSLASDGVTTLEQQGILDTPLLSVAETMRDSLLYVRNVTDVDVVSTSSSNHDNENEDEEENNDADIVLPTGVDDERHDEVELSDSSSSSEDEDEDSDES
jgi:hypothetical protein